MVTKIKCENNLILKRLFTKSTLNNLLDNSSNDLFTYIINHYIKEKQGKRNGELISELYKLIAKEYRMEYFYKNTLLNKTVFGRYSVNTATALTEVPISKSKADFIILNNKKTAVYEIKTELDTLERLESQINDYYKVFKNVIVITCEEHYEKLSRELRNPNVGIYVLTKRNTISIKKEAQESNLYLDKKAIFKVLRKNEFEEIIYNVYGFLPETTQFKYYNECYKLFEKINMELIYSKMIAVLKKRIVIDKKNFNKVPCELKFLVYFSEYKDKDYQKLWGFLEEEYRG